MNSYTIEIEAVKNAALGAFEIGENSNSFGVFKINGDVNSKSGITQHQLMKLQGKTTLFENHLRFCFLLIQPLPIKSLTVRKSLSTTTSTLMKNMISNENSK